ncbi:hypothetical protein BC835DRAFT_1317717 [Cytidiella melzeri]|nr:hypothetical protein BC835DRAFT_1317717 [Cytidiella melzeri]
MSGLAETVMPATGTQVAVSQTPPIVELFQFAYKLAGSTLAVVWTVATYLFKVLRTASLPFTALFSTLYGPISYVLAPFVLSITILVNALVIIPYTILQSILSAVYPLYAFLVVSLVFATGIALCARGVSHLGKNALAYTVNDAVAAPSASKKSKQTRPKKVSIKEEHS